MHAIVYHEVLTPDVSNGLDRFHFILCGSHTAQVVPELHFAQEGFPAHFLYLCQVVNSRFQVLQLYMIKP